MSSPTSASSLGGAFSAPLQLLRPTRVGSKRDPVAHRLDHAGGDAGLLPEQESFPHDDAGDAPGGIVYLHRFHVAYPVPIAAVDVHAGPDVGLDRLGDGIAVTHVGGRA